MQIIKNAALIIVLLFLFYMAFRAMFMEHSSNKRKAVATFLSVALFASAIYVLTLVGE